MTAPRPVVSNDVLLESLTSQIHVALRTFHEHSKSCKPCRNPIRTYQDRRDLCPEGRVQCASIMELLYRKAALVPKGTFTVEYKQGWEAVDGLIRIICHNRQGEYTNKVIDLARAVPKDSIAPKPRSAESQRKSVEYIHGHSSNSSGFASDSDDDVPRGSAYHEEMARRSGQHYTTSSSHKPRSHSRSRGEGHHHHRPEPMAAYANPRTSYLDTPSAFPQAEHPPSSPTTSSNKSFQSNKSVHFNTVPEVREFEPERRRVR
jgi:hypothetical protein